jgi:hypothetical protein
VRKLNKKPVLIMLAILLSISIFIFAALFSSCAPKTSSTAQETELIESTTKPQSTGSDSLEAQNGTANTDAPETEPTNIEAIQESILAGYNALLETGPTPDKLLAYIDANSALSTPDTMSELLEKLEYVQKAYIDIITGYLFEGSGQQTLMESFASEEEFTKENLSKIKDESLRADMGKVFDGGFKFVNLEGSFYPIIDFEFLKKYSANLTDEYNDYINLRAEESNNIYSRDAGLMISWDELAKRMIDSENYLVKYFQDSPRKVEAGRLFLGYFSAYIYGQDNTPTRDYSTNVVLDEVIQSYKKTIAENPDSGAVAAVSDLLSRLEKNAFVLDEDLLSSFGIYISELVKAHGLDSPYIILEQLRYLNYPSEHAVYGNATLSNGKYTEKNDSGSAVYLTVTLTDFSAAGDLNGDKINDAVAILAEDAGGSGTFYYLHAIYNGGFYIYSIANAFIGDRVKIKGLKIEDGIIYVDMVRHKPEDPMCCPTDEVTRKFKLEGYDLIEL